MEQLYQYLWKTSLRGYQFTDVDGIDIQVLDPGVHNHDSGPDFFNSRLRINGTEWVGNVEIHVKASDWYRHSHENDPAYENVILHVVAVSDRRIARKDGSTIPQIVISLPEEFFTTYQSLASGTLNIRCGSSLGKLSRLNKIDWLESLVVERMQQKAEKVNNILAATCGDWEQVCFILLARGLGFGLNADPFEMLAKSLPLNILHHHSDNPFQLDALLFGQAGMLDATLYMFDEYYQGLCREYWFLSRKYGLRPLKPGLWKYSRTRPQNFPHRRIAFLSNATVDGFSMFHRLLDTCREPKQFPEVFDLTAQGYWATHYSFDTEASGAPARLSASSKMLLVINVAIPLLYAYASTVGDIDLGETITGLLRTMPSENNSLIREWKQLGIESEDASQSQALIHLRKEYCDKNGCLSCRFGHYFLRKSAQIS